MKSIVSLPVTRMSQARLLNAHDNTLGHAYRQERRTAVALGFGLGILMAIVAPALLLTVFVTDSFEHSSAVQASELSLIFSVGLALSIHQYLQGRLLVVSGHRRKVLHGAMLWVATNAIGDVALAPAFGVQGVAASTVLSSMLLIAYQARNVGTVLGSVDAPSDGPQPACNDGR